MERQYFFKLKAFDVTSAAGIMLIDDCKKESLVAASSSAPAPTKFTIT